MRYVLTFEHEFYLDVHLYIYSKKMSIFLLVFPFYEMLYFLGERNGRFRRRALYGKKEEEKK